MPPPRSLVTGATGYIGGRLVPQLLEAGHDVRVLVRSEEKARSHEWADDVEIAVGDASDDADVSSAMQDVDVLYYLLHSIGTGGDFGATEKEMAQRFADEAKRAGVSRIVYLGGMIPDDEELSEHLSSRGEVGDVLLGSGVPTTVLQAGVVIGSGSASFEMLRYLTERLPAMVTPKWVNTRIQPIAVPDVLRYLVGSADMPPDVNRRFDIGGPEVLTYLDLMQRFAAISGLPKRRVVKVPLLTPGLSSHWIGLVTPVPASLARPLVESLRNTVVAGDTDIAQYVPDPSEGLIGFDRSVELALATIQDLEVPRSWEPSGVAGAPAAGQATDPAWAGGSLYREEWAIEADARPEQVWSVIENLGGRNGWFSASRAWEVRGVLDRLVGGPGSRRGRDNPRQLVVGDAVDFWRVEETDGTSFVRLRAEMKLPGMVWLELRVEPADDGATTLRQRVAFAPKGLLGHAYWWAIRPLHRIVFASMQRDIVTAAEALPN